MRLIHTADWHLCDRLGRVDRTDDLRARVEEVAALCEEHRADVLVVAGDVFSEGAHVTLDVMNDALEHLSNTFARFFERDGTVIAVTGNHDREARVELIRRGMRFAAPAGGGRFRPGRLYLQNRPFLGTLDAHGERVQFALVPYPTTVRYGLPPGGFQSKADENRALNNGVVEQLTAFGATLDPKLPTVLVGHLHVAGAGLSHTLFQISEADDVVFDTGPLGGPQWQYVALGHIHLAQSLPGLPHARYSGGLDRLHMDERGYTPGVVLAEIGPRGLTREPEVLPLTATPMCKLEITDPSGELDSLARRVESAETALVHVTATYVPGGPSRDQITRAVRAAFPRYTELAWAKAEAGGNGTDRVRPGADHRTAVRDYLARRLEGDRDRDTLMKLAEEFLTGEAEQ